MAAFGRCGAVVVLLIAIVIGAVPAIFLYVIPLLEDRDGFEALKGASPAWHVGKPFGFTFDRIPDLKGKVAVVTGANVGLGYWTAHHLALKGAQVVLACRSAEKCAAAEDRIRKNHTSATIESLLLDLSDLSSVRTFAANFQKKYKRLDVLVLNAGIMFPPYTLSKDGIELQFATNHVGHHLLSTLLLPVLAASKPSTVTVVSSNAHFNSYPEGIRPTKASLNDEGSYDRFQAYGQSKLANVLFAQELAERAPAGVFVNAAHPGGVDTELARHLVESIKAVLGNEVGESVGRWLQSMAPLWDAETASLTQLFTAVAPEVTCGQGITGKYYHPIARLTRPHAHARNATLQKELWRLTEELIKEAATPRT